MEFTKMNDSLEAGAITGVLIWLYTRAAIDSVMENDKVRISSHQAPPIPFSLE